MASSTPNQDFSLIIVTPDEILLETKAKKVMVPGTAQELAILPDHTPLYAEVKKGTIVVTMTNGREKTIPVENGIMRVKLNKVSIILGFE